MGGGGEENEQQERKNKMGDRLEEVYSQRILLFRESEQIRRRLTSWREAKR
jgi:hypothetical protein